MDFKGSIGKEKGSPVLVKPKPKSVSELEAIFSKKMPFEEGLKIAEINSCVLVHYFGACFSESKKEEFASGKMYAYVEKEKPFGEKIEWFDTETGTRWVFIVPEDLRGAKKGLLLVDHPFWFLENEGINRVIHPHSDSVRLLENFDRSANFRVFSWSPFEGYQSPRFPLEEFIEKNGVLKYSDGKYTRQSYYRGGFISMIDKCVGPVILKKNNLHPQISDVNLFWSPNQPCYMDFERGTNIPTLLSPIDETEIIRIKRQMGVGGEMAHVTTKSGLNIKVIPGSYLDCLSEMGLESQFSCHTGTCGKCLVNIRDGEHNLIPLSNEDRFYGIGQEQTEGKRLLCITKLERGTVNIDYTKK